MTDGIAEMQKGEKMRPIDANELKEHVYRDRLDSRERIANLIDSMPTVQLEATCRGCQYEPRYSLDEPCATCSNNYVNKWRGRNA